MPAFTIFDLVLTLSAVISPVQVQNAPAGHIQQEIGIVLVADNINRPPSGTMHFSKKSRLRRFPFMDGIQFTNAFDDAEDIARVPDTSSGNLKKPYITYRPNGSLHRIGDDD